MCIGSMMRLGLGSSRSCRVVVAVHGVSMIVG
jgi:hypothetical protein